MFIPNQKFSDETTLMEMLFDFGLGTPSPLVEGMVAGINNDLKENIAYQEYYKSLQEEDDRTELYTEERDMRLAEILMEKFTSFAVKDARLYGVKDNKEELLYTIDLH